jgi:hypothetical protein
MKTIDKTHQKLEIVWTQKELKTNTIDSRKTSYYKKLLKLINLYDWLTIVKNKTLFQMSLVTILSVLHFGVLCFSSLRATVLSSL